MDAANGQRMLQLFAIIGGVMAGVVQPVIGYIFDRIGLRLFFAIVNVALLVNILLMDTAIARFRPFHVQVIVLIISTFVQVQKNGTFCAVFILKMHHFPKADSGQTQGKHSKKSLRVFLQSSWAVVVLRWNIFFVPPSLNGTAIGVTFALAGVLQVSVTLPQQHLQ
jgi:hypothetical protein